MRRSTTDIDAESLPNATFGQGMRSKQGLDAHRGVQMYAEVAALTHRFLEQARAVVLARPDCGIALNLSAAESAVLSQLSGAQIEAVASAGVIIFRVALHPESSWRLAEELRTSIEEYFYVARGLFHAAPYQSRILLGLRSEEARRLASTGVSDIRAAWNESRIRVSFRYSMTRLAVFGQLRTTAQRRAFFTMNLGRV